MCSRLNDNLNVKKIEKVLATIPVMNDSRNTIANHYYVNKSLRKNRKTKIICDFEHPRPSNSFISRGFGFPGLIGGNYLVSKLYFQRSLKEMQVRSLEKLMESRFVDFYSFSPIEDISISIGNRKYSIEEKNEFSETTCNAYSNYLKEYLECNCNGNYQDLVSELRVLLEYKIKIRQTLKILSLICEKIRRISILSIKELLRNLRQLYTTHHSFHFKNLDDYHSTNLNLSF